IHHRPLHSFLHDALPISASLPAIALSTRVLTSKELNASTTCGYDTPCAVCAKSIQKYAYHAKKKPRPCSGLLQETILKALSKPALAVRKPTMSGSSYR